MINKIISSIIVATLIVGFLAISSICLGADSTQQVINNFQKTEIMPINTENVTGIFNQIMLIITTVITLFQQLKIAKINKRIGG